MSRLHEMKSKGLDNVQATYSRSKFFGKGKTMREVVDDISELAATSGSGREHTSKTKRKTWKALLKV